MLSFESPVRTPWHGLSAGFKLCFLCIMTLVLFVQDSLLWQVSACLGCGILYAVCGLAVVQTGLSRLRILIPFVLVLLVWHGLTQTIMEGLLIIVRLIALVALSNLITMTTRLSDIMDFLGTLLAPLKKLGISTRPMEMAIALVVRFTPALTEKGQTIVHAWRARSIKRPGWQIVFPLSLVAIDDAEHVAEALKARGGLIAPILDATANNRKKNGT